MSWILEDLWQQPILTSPNVVREYLAVHYGGEEREVFSCLFLDSRHRLIAVEEMFFTRPGDLPPQLSVNVAY